MKVESMRWANNMENIEQIINFALRFGQYILSGIVVFFALLLVNQVSVFRKNVINDSYYESIYIIRFLLLLLAVSLFFVVQ